MRGTLCQLMFMPSPISGTRRWASRAMIRKSSATASATPPPTQKPSMAQIVTAALMMAYAFIGFAVLHTLTLALRSRALWLSCTYAVVVVFGWPVLAMVVLGLLDAVFGLRARYLRTRPPRFLVQSLRARLGSTAKVEITGRRFKFGRAYSAERRQTDGSPHGMPAGFQT